MEGVGATEWEELLGVGIKRRVLVEGDGDSPELGHLVFFNWEGKSLLPNGETDAVFAKRTGVKARIGDGDEIPGLELALRHMRTGQRCVVRCETRFAYGPDGCPATQPGDTNLSPNTDIELLVELVEIISTTAATNMTPAEKMEEYQRKKKVGNDHFTRKAFKKAVRSYASVLQTISEGDSPCDSVMCEEARQLQIDCGNNVAMAYMRLGDLEKSKEATVGVLVLDPLNPKALFRAGQVSSLQGNFAEAKLALRKALDVKPDSKEVQAELGRLSVLVKAYRSKEKAMQKRMGQSMFSSVERGNDLLGNKTDVAAQSSSSGALSERDGACTVVSNPPEEVKNGDNPMLARYPVLLVCLVAALAAWGRAYFAHR